MTELTKARSVRVIDEELAPLRTRLDELTGQTREMRQIVDPPFYDAESHSLEQRLEARRGLRDLEPELDDVQLAAAGLERERREAVAQERTQARVAWQPRLRKAVSRLDTALAKAAQTNDDLLAELEAFTAATGETLSDVAWRELMAETPTIETRLGLWRRLLRQRGLLK